MQRVMCGVGLCSSGRWRLCSLLPASLLAVTLLVLDQATAHAQQGTVAGVVVAERSGRPLGGAQVSVVGTNQGTITDASGRFVIPGVTGPQATLQVVMIGYRRTTQEVRVGDTAARIALAETAVELDEVVVTGTVGGTQRRALGNAVSTVNAAAVTEIAPVNNIQELINGRAAGVVIQPGSGAVGTGSRIRVRGASSLSLNNEPLIYVDGVRVSNAFATGPQNQGFGSSSISRFNDFNPDEIESIEIIKGPAAATLYGTEAAGGVVQIITRRGTSGAPRWNMTVKQGANYFQNPEGRLWTNYQQITNADNLRTALDNGGVLVDPARGIVSVDIVELERARGRPIFRTGHLQEYDLNVRGGTDLIRYFASGGWESNEGVEASNDLDRWSTRLNLSVTPSPRFSIDASLGYLDSDTRLSAEAGFGGTMFTTVLADPRNLVDPRRRGFHSGIPEAYDVLYNFSQGINRFTGSLQLNHQPANWLRHRLTVGTDQTREDNIIFFPRIDSLTAYPAFGNEALGRKDSENRDLRVNTVDYSASAVFDLTPALRSTTSLGGQYYTSSANRLFAQGFIFPAPGLSSIRATTDRRVNDEDFVEDRTLGFFVQQEFGFQDRLFLTAAVRADDNSAFGQNFDRVYYPKLSASWVVSEEPFWGVPYLGTLKLRAAYGESGKQPQTFAALRTYEPVPGPNDGVAVRPEFIGNPDLGPERGREVELGFDAGFLDDRVGLEFTFYNQRTEDAILEREIAPSLGFSGFQFFNVGAIRNSGLELLTRVRPIDRERLGLDLTFTLATNRSEVLDLGPGVEFVSGGSFVRHQVGYPVGSYFERRIVSAELNAEGRAVNVLCDDGQGGTMGCANAPPVFIGRSLPDLEGSFSTSLTFLQNFRLYGLLDFKSGYRKIDGNTRVRCTFFGGRCRENFFPQEFDPVRIAGVQSSPAIIDFLIDDASFTKLREVSLSYTLPPRLAGRMGAGSMSLNLAGRNLHTWTSFGGLEPEAMFLGGTRGGNFGAWEQTTLPQLAQWVASLSVSF